MERNSTGPPTRARGLISREAWWTAVVIALAAVGIAALWPAEPHAPQSAPSQVQVSPGDVYPSDGSDFGDATAEMLADEQLVGPRAAARLEDCPKPVDARRSAGPLAGLAVPCLGRPGTTDLGAALQGRPALLNVWASWCRPCREEIPVLQAYSRQPGSVPVIGINVKDEPAAALRLLAELGASYPSVVDQNNLLWSALRVPSAIPVSFVLRADGSLDRVEPLAVFHDADQIRTTVQRYLGSS
ncbi:TlpA family protein disulfide reductase [Pseudonocardia sp. D17]|uniref:TlpA family protein disulfide reductase n=1 Tax=Pseudonocardia sp. D17 TaxID=882661 RepID=UPI002B37C98F|nr:hypothetical protein PSD17_19960 [Pseudonocardia sp. D17]